MPLGPFLNSQTVSAFAWKRPWIDRVPCTGSQIDENPDGIKRGFNSRQRRQHHAVTGRARFNGEKRTRRIPPDRGGFSSRAKLWGKIIRSHNKKGLSFWESQANTPVGNVLENARRLHRCAAANCFPGRDLSAKPCRRRLPRLSILELSEQHRTSGMRSDVHLRMMRSRVPASAGISCSQR